MYSLEKGSSSQDWEMDNPEGIQTFKDSTAIERKLIKTYESDDIIDYSIPSHPIFPHYKSDDDDVDEGVIDEEIDNDVPSVCTTKEFTVLETSASALTEIKANDPVSTKLQLLASTSYPLSVNLEDNRWTDHIHYVHVGLHPHDPDFKVMIKIECINKYCSDDELILPCNLWDQLYDIRTEYKFRRFFETNKCSSEEAANSTTSGKRLNIETNYNEFGIEFRVDYYSSYGNQVVIRFDKSFICLKEREFNHLLYIAPVINHCRRSLVYTEFSQFYYSCVNVLSVMLKHERNYNKKPISNDIILFYTEMLCIHSVLNRYTPHGQYYQMILEIVKLYPNKMIEDVQSELMSFQTSMYECQQQQNQQKEDEYCSKEVLI